MAKNKRSAGRTVGTILLVLILLGAMTAVGVYSGIKNYNHAYNPESTELIDVDIESGSGTTKIAYVLEKAGVIRSAQIFKFKTKFMGLDGKYQAGHYTLSPSMTMEKIMEALQNGKLPEISFTVPEGMTLSEVATKLAKDGIVSSKEDFLSALEDDYDYSFLPAEGYAVGELTARANRLEGYLYPETYRVLQGADAHTIINTMLAYFKSHVYDAFKSKVPGGYTLHDMVILASLIEKETGAEKDRKTVAGVFWNRLNKPMMLQTDVSIKYVMGYDKWDKELDSPYNTYKYLGLTPGPICSPGYNSIDAAINPEKTDYFYFVLKGDGSREYNFAVTYAEHLENVRIYSNAPYSY